MNEHKEWFSEWFDSPYYHVLYQNRDETEAEFFLSKLVAHLNFSPEMLVADLACGKGRHSIYLNKLGFDVIGVDLSVRSIAEAKQAENDRLHFEVMDLRELKFDRKIDVALNLFTSFGYFQSAEEDLNVLNNIHRSLNPNGIAVIDFFNTTYVLDNLVEHESKVIDGIQFNISRWSDSHFIYKKIVCAERQSIFEFTEKVQLISDDKFDELLQQSGFVCEAKFGNYALEPFNKSRSERLILVARKRD